MSTINFWKESEIKAATTAIEKIGNVSKAARWLAPKLRRPLAGVTAKMYEIKSGVTPKREAAKQTKGIQLPLGFELNLEYKKATIHEGYIKLYF